jgi:hypothetical protein
LHHILNEDPKSIVHRVFNSQMKNKTKKDWVTTVLQDLQWLGLNDLSMEEIKILKKTVWKNMIKQRLILKTFETLDNVKKSHSKVKHIEHTEHTEHTEINMRKYLQPNKIRMRKEEAYFQVEVQNDSNKSKS